MDYSTVRTETKDYIDRCQPLSTLVNQTVNSYLQQ